MLSIIVSLVSPKPGTAAPATQPIYDIPRLQNISVSADPNGWHDAGFEVESMADDAPGMRNASDFDATSRLAWNDHGLLVLLRVWDDTPIESDSEALLWKNDSVELFLTPKLGDPKIWQAVISPGVDGKHANSRCRVYAPNPAAPSTQPTIARTKAPGGYFLEALLPWSNVGIDPTPGREIGFQICINDDDGNRVSRASWYPRSDSAFNPHSMQRLRLSDTASSPSQVSVNAVAQHFRQTRMKLLAGEELAGKSFEVRSDGHLLATGQFTAQEKSGYRTRAVGQTAFPEASSHNPTPLDVLVDGRSVASFELAPPDADSRANEIAQMPFRFHPPVFCGEAFPDGDFENTWEAEDLLGQYSIATTFYNANFEPVTQPIAPGRYGAIAVITTADKHLYKRYITLFRQPGAKVRWRDQNLSKGLLLPAEFGIDPATIREHQATLNTNLQWMMRQSMAVDSDQAVILAALFEAKPAAGDWDETTDPFARDRQWWYTLRQKLGDPQRYTHLDFMPVDYARDPEKKWPLILFLHGAGERGDDLEGVRKDVGHITESDFSKSFIVIAPQCPSGETWNPLLINDLLDESMQKYHADPDRIYLTGFSMGGSGAWLTAFLYPTRFAAVAPLSGRGDPAAASRIKDLPTWIFHGTDDPTMDFEFSQKMWDALKAIKARSRFTIYPGYLHDVWTATYSAPDLYNWFLEQRRGHPQQAPATQPIIAPKAL